MAMSKGGDKGQDVFATRTSWVAPVGSSPRCVNVRFVRKTYFVLTVHSLSPANGMYTSQAGSPGIVLSSSASLAAILPLASRARRKGRPPSLATGGKSKCSSFLPGTQCSSSRLTLATDLLGARS